MAIDDSGILVTYRWDGPLYVVDLTRALTAHTTIEQGICTGFAFLPRPARNGLALVVGISSGGASEYLAIDVQKLLGRRQLVAPGVQPGAG